MFYDIHTHVAWAVLSDPFISDLQPLWLIITMTTETSQAVAREGESEDEREEDQKWRDCVFFLVGNIPAKFRSADLRAVFSQFVEKEHFVCFHYRHRPEQIQATQAETTNTTSSNSESAVVMATDVGGSAHSHSEAGGVAKTKCCVVALERKDGGGRGFTQMYANKNWSTADGGFLRQKVRITELKLDFKTTHKNMSPHQGKIIMQSLSQFI